MSPNISPTNSDSKDRFLQKCREAWKKISEPPTDTLSVVLFDLPALFLVLWASLTLFGVWENGGWYLPDDLWKVIAVLVLMFCTEKVILMVGRS